MGDSWGLLSLVIGDSRGFLSLVRNKCLMFRKFFAFLEKCCGRNCILKRMIKLLVCFQPHLKCFSTNLHFQIVVKQLKITCILPFHKHLLTSLLLWKNYLERIQNFFFEKYVMLQFFCGEPTSIIYFVCPFICLSVPPKICLFQDFECPISLPYKVYMKFT